MERWLASSRGPMAPGPAVPSSSTVCSTRSFSVTTWRTLRKRDFVQEPAGFVQVLDANVTERLDAQHLGARARTRRGGRHSRRRRANETPWCRSPAGPARLARFRTGRGRTLWSRQSRKTAWSLAPRSEADWSMMPVGAPTKSFSARCVARTISSALSPAPVSSLRAEMTAHSMACEEDSPAPRGTSESRSRSRPGTSMPRSLQGPDDTERVLGPALGQ